MKIGMFTEAFHPQLNGVVTYVSDVAEELTRRGNKVDVYAPEIKGYRDSARYIHRLPGIKALSKMDANQRLVVPLPNKEFRKMLTAKFDLIHAHTGGPVSLWGFQLAKTKGVPYVLTYHTLLTSYLHYIFNGKVIKPKVVEVLTRVYGNQCDAIIAPSEKIRQELIRYGVHKPVFVVPNSVDVARFTGQKKGYLREKFGIRGKILLFVGRVSKEKNVEFLLKSFQIVASKSKEATLVIVGKGADLENLQRLSEELGLSERVVFTGPIPMAEIPKVYADGDIFFFPSISEVHPMVVLEATVSGLPVGTVQDSAYLESVKDDINGYQTKISPTAFASATLSLLKDEEKRTRFGEASALIGRKQFSLENHVDKLTDLYEAVIDNYHPSTFSEAVGNMGKLRQIAKYVFNITRNGLG